MRQIIGVFCLLSMVFFSSGAFGGTLYGISAGFLKSVDLSTGSIEIIGPVDTENYWIGDLAFSPDGELYGVARHYNQDPDILVKLDLETAEVIEIGSFAMSGLQGIAFDGDGALYGASSGDYRGLIRIDPETCDITRIGRYGLGKRVITGLTLSPAGQLLGIVNDSTHSGLYTIDKESGVAGLVGEIGYLNVDCISFDADGRLYGVAGWMIIEIDPITVSYRVVVDPSLWMTGCAVKETEPEPECPEYSCPECPYEATNEVAPAKRLRGHIRQNLKKKSGRATLRVDYNGIIDLEKNPEIDVIIRVPNANREIVDVVVSGKVKSITNGKKPSR